MTPETPRQSIGQFLRREPLVHFLLGACLLFLLQAVFAPDTRDRVVISKTTINYLVEQKENLLLRPVTKQERQEIVDLYIEEELLVREARKLGFENSSRIRSLLIQNMRAFLAKDVPETKEQDLRAFFDTNPEEFRIPDRYSLNHVSFQDPPEALEALEAVLAQLQAGADPETLGDKVPGLGVAIPGRSAGQLVIRDVWPGHCPCHNRTQGCRVVWASAVQLWGAFPSGDGHSPGRRCAMTRWQGRWANGFQRGAQTKVPRLCRRRPR